MNHPHLLLLLVLAAVPLLLHLLDRRRAQVVRWPGFRLLVGSSSRLHRLRWLEALLLTCRTLAVIAAVLMIAQPAYQERILERGLPNAPRHLFLLVDTTISMSYQAAPSLADALERAKAGCVELLDSLRPSDDVTIVTTTGTVHIEAPANPATQGARPKARLGNSTPSTGGARIESVRRALRDLDFEAGPFTLPLQLDAAATHVQRRQARIPEVYVFTDLQQSLFSLEDVPRLGAILERFRHEGRLPTLNIVDCGAEQRTNRFVTGLHASTLPLVQGESTEFSAQLELAGGVSEPTTALEPTETAATSPLRFRFDTEVTPGEARSGSAHAQVAVARRSVPAVEEWRVTAEGPADGLRADDQAYFVADVAPALRVLVVGEPRTAGSTEYVHTALYPAAEGDTPPESPFRPRSADVLITSGMDSADIVVLCDPLAPNTEALARLREFVRRGGGLIVCVGPRTAGAPWSTDLFAGGTGVLPADFRAERARPATPYRLRTIDFAHPILAPFAAPDDGDLGRIRFHAVSKAGEIAPGSRILATFGGGEPWLIEKYFGAGHVLVVTTRLDLTDSTLPHTPLLVPLLHQCCRYSASSTANDRNLELGQPVSWNLAGQNDIVRADVLDPLGDRFEARIEGTGGERRALYEKTFHPGFYSVKAMSSEGDIVLEKTFALNVPRQESDPRRIDESVKDELRSRFDAAFTQDVKATLNVSRETLKRRELWPWFAALTFACLVLELIITRGLMPSPRRASERKP